MVEVIQFRAKFFPQKFLIVSHYDKNCLLSSNVHFIIVDKYNTKILTSSIVQIFGFVGIITVSYIFS